MLPAELVNPSVRRGPFRAVLFDFDGTLSLIREGWPAVMVGMMVERLRTMGLLREPESEDWAGIERLVMAKNGAPTIKQMDVFAEEVARRGGPAVDAWECLRDYIDRLMAEVRGRWTALESGAARPAAWVVPNAHAILANLKARGVPTFVASGTEYDHVSTEANLLGVAPFFPTGINAPRDNDPSFGKGKVIHRVLKELGIRGEELLGFGDGVVETSEVKRVGGVAVGVASCPEGTPRGTVQPEKRARLIAAGADLIVPDYSQQDGVIRWLWGEE
ncbi:Haloacid dehalogenase domain protein hydrolase OS=Treponema azotonutricium (strain ATCC BAA-888 / DSM 13862 / ZAS-9) GN=TREAZ_1014 PE=4 SV=1: Hydrolase [Gemmataceae bacterium]|nr:Haloacid dehalogenase domain protein hydrolase OS=Treponema azotonutricium (strain ATCC BAA-888 / DSM 13862 / ZAS-9) GN=TREAZ_1014 PE=4 SV=1: Hydrolase [Gemmataceae bacterium]VTU01775.1 Haloacid dehalogenase domain protein hydrolase OS=Treponema azotonutricium (strain ATCC BAA-888 / DSM 13862 / ZAS-9) GN=TREAZ_1014 PE=4 SV=1: Hydrolase [Gemmataceae bacterium]